MLSENSGRTPGHPSIVVGESELVAREDEKGGSEMHRFKISVMFSEHRSKSLRDSQSEPFILLCLRHEQTLTFSLSSRDVLSEFSYFWSDY